MALWISLSTMREIQALRIGTTILWRGQTISPSDSRHQLSPEPIARTSLHYTAGLITHPQYVKARDRKPNRDPNPNPNPNPNPQYVKARDRKRVNAYSSIHATLHASRCTDSRCHPRPKRDERRQHILVDATPPLEPKPIRVRVSISSPNRISNVTPAVTNPNLCPRGDKSVHPAWRFHKWLPYAGGETKTGVIQIGLTSPNTYASAIARTRFHVPIWTLS